MALAQDISNVSIRDAIRLIAEAVDKTQPADISALTVAVGELRAAVRQLDISINGEPPATAPTSPVS